MTTCASLFACRGLMCAVEAQWLPKLAEYVCVKTWEEPMAKVRMQNGCYDGAELLKLSFAACLMLFTTIATVGLFKKCFRAWRARRGASDPTGKSPKAASDNQAGAAKSTLGSPIGKRRSTSKRAILHEAGTMYYEYSAPSQNRHAGRLMSSSESLSSDDSLFAKLQDSRRRGAPIFKRTSALHERYQNRQSDDDSESSWSHSSRSNASEISSQASSYSASSKSSQASRSFKFNPIAYSPVDTASRSGTDSDESEGLSSERAFKDEMAPGEHSHEPTEADSSDKSVYSSDEDVEECFEFQASTPDDEMDESSADSTLGAVAADAASHTPKPALTKQDGEGAPAEASPAEASQAEPVKPTAKPPFDVIIARPSWATIEAEPVLIE